MENFWGNRPEASSDYRATQHLNHPSDERKKCKITYVLFGRLVVNVIA